MRSFFTVFILCRLVDPSFAGCLAENAVYKNMEDPKFVLTFSKQKNPKAWSNIQATLQTPKQKLDFEFTASNGYGMQYLVLLNKPSNDDEDDIVDFFDRNQKDLPLPQVGALAPAFVFAPKLGLWMNYAKHQEYLPRAMFKFDHCKK